ncbi:MAG: alpha-mannosidase [Lachnospiraceae bacterium]|nr:alpha-mannosidase [Lachnospiraceae bacterium]
MIEKLFLICNAHLDPVWQWEWEEGAAEALSTFRIAAKFCEEYDGFVFCHNEALLYQWVEAYEPELFTRIQKLVKQKKWHIMGGWYLQPDCNMPSGEGFVRQILTGKKYFLEKFGVSPSTAVNVDPFGHSRGLVQIMKKCGYNGYLFMRPGDGDRYIKLPADEFKWIGYDDSEIIAVRIDGSYNSSRGCAAKKVREYLKNSEKQETAVCLWGVGNHGGGPSRKDLEDLTDLIREKEKENVLIIHSTPEEYLAEIEKRKNLPAVRKSLVPWAVGCYSSQSRIKQLYRMAESTYFFAESMCAHAAVLKQMEYPQKELNAALKDILSAQFHDMLPGTSVLPVEKAGMRMLDHALEILSRIKEKAFLSMTFCEKPNPENCIPIYAYNPYPYEISGDFLCELMLWDQDWEHEFLIPEVWGEDGKRCPTQSEKENSTIPLQWRKRVVFHGVLKPMSMNLFQCGFRPASRRPFFKAEEKGRCLCIKRKEIEVLINYDTGLICNIKKNNDPYVKENAFGLEVYEDNYDPWYMEKNTWKKKEGEFHLLDPKEAAEFCCTDTPLNAVRVIEDGEVRTVVEALFGYHHSYAVVRYIISETGDLEVKLHMVWNEKQKLVKMNVPSVLKEAECMGEQAYGQELLNPELEENISQKYQVLYSGEKGILIVNNGVYGSSFCGEEGTLKITLLRSPSYCAHPIPGRTTMPQDRYMPYIDQGEHDFSFLFRFGTKEKMLRQASRTAQEFQAPPMLLSCYPPEKSGEKNAPVQLLHTDTIQFVTLKKAEDGEYFFVRLFNPTDKEQSAVLHFQDKKEELNFEKYEIKTIRCSCREVIETELQI